MTRLGLGTAQFGLDYGVSNGRGKCPPHAVREILGTAAQCGVGVLDTAAAYGDAETVLGRCLGADHGFDIVTKVPPIDHDPRTLIEHFARSQVRLRQLSVHGLMVHRAADLMGPRGDEIWGILVRLRERGDVARIGVSAYGVGDIEPLLDRFDLDLVQLPFNAFDQGLVAGGGLDRLKRRGIEVHVRSVLLQGLLLMAPDALPPHLAAARGPLATWRGVLAAHGLTPLEGALALIADWPQIDVAVVGVTRADELRDIAAAADIDVPRDIDWRGFAIDDPEITDPRGWLDASYPRAGINAA